jgi:hypothetical protein
VSASSLLAVEPPTITHELTVAKVQSWLEANGTTPREQAKKVTLRQVSRGHRTGAGLFFVDANGERKSGCRSRLW